MKTMNTILLNQASLDAFSQKYVIGDRWDSSKMDTAVYGSQEGHEKTHKFQKECLVSHELALGTEIHVEYKSGVYHDSSTFVQTIKTYKVDEFDDFAFLIKYVKSESKIIKE